MDQRECDLMVRKHELYILSRAGGQRANFSYRNLTGLNLACKNLQEADFTGAIMVECDLSGTNLTRALLFCTNLTKAKMVRANLTRADLRGAVLRNANLYGAVFLAADRTGADDTGALTDAPRGKPMSMLKESLHTLIRDHQSWVESGGASGKAHDVSGFDLRDIEWPEHALLTSLKAAGACLAHARIKGAWLQASTFEGADLRGADLRGANLKSTNLVRANFENSNLAPLVVASGRALVTRLDGAVLRHARFVGCQLVQTSFRAADLRWSSFVDCESTGADFEQAIGRPASAVASSDPAPPRAEGP
jgi:uncharacterized protein YjbI with pentapeptide repeats